MAALDPRDAEKYGKPGGPESEREQVKRDLELQLVPEAVMQRERDEARAEIARLSAERDGLVARINDYKCDLSDFTNTALDLELAEAALHDCARALEGLHDAEPHPTQRNIARLLERHSQAIRAARQRGAATGDDRIPRERVRWAWEIAGETDHPRREEAIVVLESDVGRRYGWWGGDDEEAPDDE